MLLISGGWPSSISNFVAGTFEPVFEDGLLDNWRPFDPLVETANRLGYTLYPVDAGGVDGNDFGSAEHGSLLDATIAAGKSYNRDYLAENTLFELAAATGGRAFVDGASYGALEGAIEDTRSYYWLGFSPRLAGERRAARGQGQGQAQRRQKCAPAAASPTLSRESKVTMLVESAQLFDLPLPGEKSLGVSFGEPAGTGYRKVTVPVAPRSPPRLRHHARRGRRRRR